MDGVEDSFTATKDELYKMFRVLFAGGGSFKGGYKNLLLVKNERMHKISQALSGLSYGSKPCPSFSFSGGFRPFTSLGIKPTLKLHLKASEIVFKAFVEMFDPNINAMIKILNLARMIGACIPPPLITLGLLPATIFGIPPFGIGIGPILTPLGFAYHALGFEQNPPDLYKLFGVDKNANPKVKVKNAILSGARTLTPQPESDSDCSNISSCEKQDKENEE
jgi:hypothetical protein